MYVISDRIPEKQFPYLIGFFFFCKWTETRPTDEKDVICLVSIYIDIDKLENIIYIDIINKDVAWN